MLIEEIIDPVQLVSPYLFGKYSLRILSCKDTHNCSSRKVIRKFHRSGMVHSYIETKKLTDISD